MALVRGTARLLLDEHARRPFSGSVLELGRMSVFFSRAELAGWARAHGVELSGDHRDPSHDPRLAAQGCMGDVAFFRSLGFDRVVSTDVSDHEGADVIFDLNDELPAELEGAFDVVFDGGTIHHVFDVPAALENAHRALKVGGRLVIASCAAHNQVDHGFYMLSPTLLHDYFVANRYRIETACFYEFDHYWARGRLYKPVFRVYRYEPGLLDDVSYGGFGRRPLSLFFVATRTAEATADRAPLQSYFARHAGTLVSAADPPRGPAPPWLRLWKRLLGPLRRWRARRKLRAACRY